MQAGNYPNTLSHFLITCKAHNLKITPQRTAIYSELIKAKNHPSADSIYQTVRMQFPNISFDTVNRTLVTFSEIGIVDLVEGLGGPRRFDPNTDMHHHFHCVKCNQIIDFTDNTYDKLEIPETIRHQCVVLNKRVVLNGVCADCNHENN